MNWVSQWLNRRAVRRFEALHFRDLEAEFLWKEGRFSEFADELDVLAQGYARETRVVGWRETLATTRARRCEALVRAGQPALAEAEAAQLVPMLMEMEGPDGPRQRKLRQRMDAAYRGVELPYD